ncbi:MAG TPA: hypothetical protein VHM65_05245, partial [Candidatus Lustribacter sp.]|nr:hypothetical protein [Candidatus Lustribacter sp.]
MNPRSVRPLIAAVAALGAVLAGPALAVAPSQAAQGPALGPALGSASGREAAPGDVRVIRSLTSLTATHRWFEQTYGGLPVVDGFYVARTDIRTGARSVTDGRQG